MYDLPAFIDKVLYETYEEREHSGRKVSFESEDNTEEYPKLTYIGFS